MQIDGEADEQDVLLLRLTNGEELIGKVVDRGQPNGMASAWMTFDRLSRVGYEQRGDRIAFGFGPFFIAAEEEPITLKSTDILCSLPAPTKIRETYLAWISPIIQARAIPTMGLVKAS